MKPENDIDYLEFFKHINKSFKNLQGIQTSGGGKFVELCFDTFEAAEVAELRGLDFENTHYELTPLGQRLIFVSTFIPIQFPDEDLLELLKIYGNVKSVRRLFHKDPELNHLENGCRVVAFTKLDKPLPKRISYGGISVGFKYTGQPNSCVKCSSFDHEINECPRRKPKPTQNSKQSSKQDLKPENNQPKENQLDQPPRETDTLNQSKHQTINETQEKPELLIVEMDTAEIHSRKRKVVSPPDSPIKSDTNRAKKTNPLNHYEEFLSDLKKERDSVKLLKSPKDLVARARALFLHQELGNVDKADTKTLSFDNKKQTLRIWASFEHKLRPDAKAELMLLFNNNFKNNYA